MPVEPGKHGDLTCGLSLICNMYTYIYTYDLLYFLSLSIIYICIPILLFIYTVGEVSNGPKIWRPSNFESELAVSADQ